jgi:hypothetical protein
VARENSGKSSGRHCLPFWQVAQRPLQIDNFTDNSPARLVDTGMPRHYKGKKLK